MPDVGLSQNHVHLGFRQQEQEDPVSLGLSLSDTRTASQLSKNYSLDACLATGSPISCHIRTRFGRYSGLTHALLGTRDYFSGWIYCCGDLSALVMISLKFCADY